MRDRSCLKGSKLFGCYIWYSKINGFRQKGKVIRELTALFAQILHPDIANYLHDFHSNHNFPYKFYKSQLVLSFK
jgi:hypothetical protein